MTRKDIRTDVFSSISDWDREFHLEGDLPDRQVQSKRRRSMKTISSFERKSISQIRIIQHQTEIIEKRNGNQENIRCFSFSNVDVYHECNYNWKTTVGMRIALREEKKTFSFAFVQKSVLLKTWRIPFCFLILRLFVVIINFKHFRNEQLSYQLVSMFFVVWKLEKKMKVSINFWSILFHKYIRRYWERSGNSFTNLKSLDRLGTFQIVQLVAKEIRLIEIVTADNGSVF